MYGRGVALPKFVAGRITRPTVAQDWRIRMLFHFVGVEVRNSSSVIPTTLSSCPIPQELRMRRSKFVRRVISSESRSVFRYKSQCHTFVGR